VSFAREAAAALLVTGDKRLLEDATMQDRVMYPLDYPRAAADEARIGPNTRFHVPWPASFLRSPVESAALSGRRSDLQYFNAQTIEEEV